MKRLLLLCLSFFCMTGGSSLNAQCIPNPEACTPTTGLIPFCFSPTIGCNGKVNRPYEQTIHFVANNSVNIPNFPGPITIARLEVVSIVPPANGLTVTMVSGNNQDGNNGILDLTDTLRNKITSAPGQRKLFGCVKVEGTPTASTNPNDSLTITLKAFVQFVPNGPIVEPPAYGGRAVNPFSLKFKIPIEEPRYDTCGAPRTTRIDLNSPFNKNEFSLYPNPANNNVTIKYPTNLFPQNKVINIFSSDGKKVLTQTIESPLNYINVNDLPNGIYMVTVSGDNHISTQKLIISR